MRTKIRPSSIIANKIDVYNSMYNIYVLFTYVDPGHVEIVDVKVFIEEERSQMKMTLRKVRLLL